MKCHLWQIRKKYINELFSFLTVNQKVAASCVYNHRISDKPVTRKLRENLGKHR